MTTIYPKSQSNTEYDIQFTDKSGGNWKLKLAGGPTAMQEIPSSPSTMAISNGGERYGDWEPGYSHVEQRDFVGGRGVENFVDDNTGYFDSQALWTLTSGKAFPAPRWQFAKGLRNEDSYIDGAFTWIKLIGGNKYAATSFSASANYDADKCYMWIRRVGTPGTLTLSLCSDNSGEPDTALQTATVDTSIITDTISVFNAFDWTGIQSLTSGTTYWIKINGDANDNAASHWEVAAKDTGASSKTSSDGSTWVDGSYKLYYRVVDSDIARRFYYFNLESALYAVSIYEDTTNSKLYINGARGKATAGGASTLTNTNAAFGTDSKYVGARIKIISGTGNGQTRLISAHTNTQITVSENWKINPNNTSRYVIYSTPYWTEITSTGLGKVTNRPCVAGRTVFFPQGASTNIRKMRANNSTHEFADDGTHKADLLYLFYADSVGKIYRANNEFTDVTVSKSSIPNWGDACSFSTAVKVGSPDYMITNMRDFNGQMWIYKEDSVWIEKGTTFQKLALAIQDNPSEENGLSVTSQDLVNYFTFLESVEYTNGGNTTDFGPWNGAGMPDGRQGNISCMHPVLSWLYAGVDGHDGVSSVLVNNDISGATGGWHEIFRGFEAGKRIQDIIYQPNKKAKGKMWIEIGGDMVYMDFPYHTMNPLRDSTFEYQHEAVFVSATHDFQFTDLPKFFKELVGCVENMVSGMEVFVDYQVDDYVGTNYWSQAGSFYTSPKDNVVFNEGKRRKIRYRLRINTNSATSAPVIDALIMKGYARTPVKRQWNMRIMANNDIKPSLKKLYQWLWETAQEAGAVLMHSPLEELDDTWVIIEPPTVIRNSVQKQTAEWTGYFALTVREA